MVYLHESSVFETIPIASCFYDYFYGNRVIDHEKNILLDYIKSGKTWELYRNEYYAINCMTSTRTNRMIALENIDKTIQKNN